MTTLTQVSGLKAQTLLPGGYPRAENLLLLAPSTGAVQVRAGAAGHGKTADLCVLVPTLAQSGVTLFAHTSGTTGEYVRDMGLNSTGVNSEVANKVRIADVGSDPRNIAILLYKSVNSAIKQGQVLPVALVLSRFNQLVWPDDFPVGSAARLLHAISQFDLAEVGSLVGLTYESWSGETLPQLPEHFMAVVTYTLRVNADSPRLSSVAGNGDLLNLAASIFFFERPDTIGNFVEDYIDGNGGLRRGLADTRGRILAVKSRMGCEYPGVDMRFDVTADAPRGRWHDDETTAITVL